VRSILADTPAFSFEPSLSPGGFKRVLRDARFAILLCIEPREVLSDDFVGAVAFDALRPEIPVGDIAAEVQQVNCVVANALHKQPELFFAPVQDLLGRLALGQVAVIFA
jgi:hypothetical protein